MAGSSICAQTAGACACQVDARPAGEDDLAEIGKYVENYCAFFGGDRDAVMAAPFTVITPDTKNPYRQMYVLN